MQKEVGELNWTECLPVIVMSCLDEICYHQTLTDSYQGASGEPNVSRTTYTNATSLNCWTSYSNTVNQLLYRLPTLPSSFGSQRWWFASFLAQERLWGQEPTLADRVIIIHLKAVPRGVEVRALWGLVKFILTKLRWGMHFFMELSSCTARGALTCWKRRTNRGCCKKNNNLKLKV